MTIFLFFELQIPQWKMSYHRKIQIKENIQKFYECGMEEFNYVR